MKFYIYHRPMHTIKFKEYMGDLIHVSCEEREFSPDGEQWKIKRCNRSEAVYNRLNKMLASGGVPSDGIYPLSDKRSLKDLVSYMNTWEKHND